MKAFAFALASACLSVAAAWADPAPMKGDPVRGQALYQSCSGCHSLDENEVGPKHRGVVGRRAGTAPGYAYSKALRDSGLVWDEATLDRWLTNPQKLVPGARMFFSVSNAQNRADLIAYLKEQRDVPMQANEPPAPNAPAVPPSKTGRRPRRSAGSTRPRRK